MASSTMALLQALNARVTYVDIQSGGTLYSVFTLDGALALWAYQVVANPGQIAGQDPTQVANGFATNYCQTHPGVDCSQQASLVAAYGATVAAALAGAPIPPLPAAPGTPAGSNVIADVPYSAVAPIPPPPPPIDQSVPSAALQALLTPAPTPAPTVATTPAPAMTPTATVTAATVAAAAAPASGPHPQFISAGGAEGGVVAGLPEAGATFGISILVGAIMGALFGGLFGGSDTQALQNAVQALRQALAQTADDLERFSWNIALGLGKTWQAVADIWDNFLDGLWSYLKQLGNSLWIVVSQVIPQIITVLKNLRKFLDDIYTKYILPAMKYLLLVRQVLAILRAMGVPIASKLDRILGQIQAALYAPMLALAQVVGGYGAWINVILTNRYTLQRPVFIRTMNAYSSDWINLFWAAQMPSLGAAGLPASAGGSALSLSPDPLAELQQYVATGTGPMAADMAVAQALMDAAMAGQV